MIDLDQNATTPLDHRVRDAMLPWLSHGNPSSVHAAGRAARAALDRAREGVAAFLGAEPGEIVFTASGSEANALALRGAALGKRPIPHIAVSSIEHPSMLEAARSLAQSGTRVTYLEPSPLGRVDIQTAERALEEGAGLVALMLANNETGVVQPAAEVAALCQRSGSLFICDGVQAAGKIPLGAIPAGSDAFVLSGHKVHGPRGIAALRVRRGLELQPLVPGHQERGRRAGTENVAAAVGLAKALELAAEATPREGEQVRELRSRFEAGLREDYPSLIIHGSAPGSGDGRLPNTTCVGFPACDGEALLIGLDLAGICASLGAACSSGSLSPSHVLLAMGVSPALARSSIRFSLGAQTTKEDLDQTRALLRQIVPRSHRT